MPLAVKALFVCLTESVDYGAVEHCHCKLHAVGQFRAVSFAVRLGDSEILQIDSGERLARHCLGNDQAAAEYCRNELEYLEIQLV